MDRSSQLFQNLYEVQFASINAIYANIINLILANLRVSISVDLFGCYLDLLLLDYLLSVTNVNIIAC